MTMNDWDDDDFENYEETELSEPWSSDDREKILQTVVMSHFRKPKTPLVQLVREAQIQIFENEPRKLREIARVPSWISKRLKEESSPTDIMFLLVDSLVKQLESQGVTLELLFEAVDAQADRIENLETEIRTRLSNVEDQLHRIRGRLQMEPPAAKPTSTVQRPVIAVVGLHPHQFSQVLDHCKRQRVNLDDVELIAAPKDTWSVPDTCHFVILSAWSGQGWDEIIRKKNKTQSPELPKTQIAHETKGLPMIALKIGEFLSKFRDSQSSKS